MFDDTEALRRFMGQTNPDMGELESVHQAELDAVHAMALMANPKAGLKAMGVPVSDESQINITMKPRADRANSTVGAPMTALRRVIVVVIHYRNCDADIIIIATR